MESQGDHVNIPEMVEGYKPPCPPKWKKRDVFNPEKMKDLDQKAKQVTVTNDMTYEELAFELTSGLKNDLQKVRALFIWLGEQDIEGEDYPAVSDARTPKGFMKLMKAKAGTFSQFFAQLCRSAKLPCVIVRGSCKSAAYEIGDQDVSDLKVTWNVVLVDGSWQIVHPMWAFTGVIGHQTGKWTKIEAEGKGTREKVQANEGVHIRLVREEYFLPHPEEFIYKCIADMKKWQLLKQPWDLHKFCNVPRLQMEYFTSGYKLTSQHKAILFSLNGKCEVEFIEKEGTKSNLTYELFFDEEQSDEKLPSGIELPRTVFFETNGNKLRLIIRFHVLGIYKLSVSTDESLADFRLEAKEKATNRSMLPANPPIGFGFGHTATNQGLSTPSHTSGVVVAKQSTVEMFSFRMKTITNIITRLRHTSVDSNTLNKYVNQTIKGNDVSIKVRMPDDLGDEEYALQVYTSEERMENNVLNYLLTNKKEDFENIVEKQRIRHSMREKKIRRNLTTALQLTMTIDALEKSIKEFEKADLKDTDGSFRKAKVLLGKLKHEEQATTDIKHLKHTLKTSMKERSAVELENAIAKVEQAGHKELEELVVSAKDLLVELEQQEIDESTASELRRRLVEATEEKKMDELEETIADFQKADLPDKGVLRKAKKVLGQLYEEAAEDALSKEDLDALQVILDDRDKSVMKKELQESEVLIRAEKFLQQQRRIKGCLSNPLKLSNATVAEIHGYNNPNSVTQDIMRASFILLGKHPKKVQTWKSIQKYLKPSGDVLKSVKVVKKESLHNNTVKWANQLLEKYTTDDVREVSAGVAAFYKWSNNMIQDRSIKNSRDD